MIIATTLIVAFVGFIVLSFMFSSNSPLHILLFPEKYKKTQKQKQAIIFYDSKQWDKARDELEALVDRRDDRAVRVRDLVAELLEGGIVAHGLPCHCT